MLVVEVLSPSTRSEDTVRKSGEYLAAGVGQYWLVDPEAGALDVFASTQSGWTPELRLDVMTSTGAVAVHGHGTVDLDLRDILPRTFA